MRALKKYNNGTYDVVIFDNGTKVRMLHDGKTDYIADFPENIDCCISKKCSLGCEFCYEDCTKEGKEFDPNNYKTKEFLNSLRPGMEIAIGGGALSEVDKGNFLNLLQFLCNKAVLVNITVNARELLKKEFKAFLTQNYVIPNFIHGLGISYNEKCKEVMLEMKKRYPNSVVIHTILSITKPEDFQWLAENNFKVLVLGYKTKGRGLTYFSDKQKEYKDWTEKNILLMRKQFKTLSFDCLAVEQLDIKNKVSEEDWASYYMGDDGNFTMYVDLVENQFAPSSTSNNSERNFLNFCGNNAASMFKYVQTNYYNKNKRRIIW